MIKPKALKKGSLLAVVSPASTPKAELVAAGVARLEGLGYRVRVSAHALDKGPLYYAGTVEDRLADLHAAFADPEVDGIVCARGGWGSAELLPGLDKELIRTNPKVFVGYSDLTSFQTWLWNEIGLVSFYAPMVAADFSRLDAAEMGSWESALGGAEEWSVGAAEGLRVLRPGKAEGVLTGGCLSIYAEALGTPYAAKAEGGILFLEDIGTKPYQWDRMLVHLRYAGMLKDVTGIVFGDMEQNGADAEIEASILHALREFEGPIGFGLRSGHVSVANVTLPLGVKVRLDLTGEPELRFVEAAVTR
ncbi:S66 peptidase family protein [Granulicella tundricola]|uniref:Peptidase U61 LD-carboxypeptidase A n=1 Tax=Granulicella tundricola (strain ATCC BAA-1859 / DSM 23138 / MP5ACTX9) TaxID=1198114 RepID=E8WYD4_GRATM|nr:LD-carboxypeptidase [Granulicella tundricola]ADW69840.1 peptidase U61 LD-carboxypeptidase A [Granulicella tundricola MP5ACTX9]